MDVVYEEVSEEFSLTAPMSISDPSNILCIMSLCVLIKSVGIKFKPPGACSALKYFDVVPFKFHRACVSFVICRVRLQSGFFWYNAFSLFSLWEMYVSFPQSNLTEQSVFSGVVTNHERSTCIEQDKRTTN